MKPTSYLLNITSKNIYADIKANNILLVRILDTQPNTTNKNISTYVINDENTFSLNIFIPSLGEGTDTNQLLTIELNEILAGNSENPQTLIKFELDPNHDYPKEEKITLPNQNFKAKIPLQNWSWQTATPIQLHSREKQTIKQFVLQVHKLFLNKESNQLLRIQDLKLSELAIATGQTKDEVVEDVKWLYQYIFNSDWTLADLTEEDIKLSTEADGRLIYISRKNNQMPIQSLPPAHGFSFEFRVSLISINGKEELVITR